MGIIELNYKGAVGHLVPVGVDGQPIFQVPRLFPCPAVIYCEMLEHVLKMVRSLQTSMQSMQLSIAFSYLFSYYQKIACL